MAPNRRFIRHSAPKTVRTLATLLKTENLSTATLFYMAAQMEAVLGESRTNARHK